MATIYLPNESATDIDSCSTTCCRIGKSAASTNTTHWQRPLTSTAIRSGNDPKATTQRTSRCGGAPKQSFAAKLTPWAAMFAALLDTSVLWPSLQRDFLLSLAIEGLYRPLWPSEILAELEYHETQKLIDRGEQPDGAAVLARHLIDQMTTAFDDTLVKIGNRTTAHSTCQTPTIRVGLTRCCAAGCGNHVF